MKEKFLPIGTVVLLKNGQKKIMITGYLPVSKENNAKKVYDYSACLFPEGVLSNKQTAVFNHEQIAEVIQEGYSNEETAKFVEALKEIAAKEGVGTVQPAPVEVSSAAPAPAVEQPVEATPAPVAETLDMPAPAEPVAPLQSSPVPTLETPVDAAVIANPVAETPVEQTTEAATQNMEMPTEVSIEAPVVDAPIVPTVDAPVVDDAPIVPTVEGVPAEPVAPVETPVEVAPATDAPVTETIAADMPAPAAPVPEAPVAPAEPVAPVEMPSTAAPVETTQPSATTEQPVDISSINPAGPVSEDSIKPFSE